MKAVTLLSLLALSTLAAAAPRDPVKFTLALEQLRAHLNASLSAYAGRQGAVARQHADQLLSGPYASVKGDLSPALRRRFERDAGLVGPAMARGAPSDEVRRLSAALAADLDAASLPDKGDPKVVAQVVSGLLAGSASAYAEGVSGGKVSGPLAYQDAAAFLERAGSLLQGATTLPTDQRGQARAAMTKLKGLIMARAAVGEVNAQVDFARRELAEVSGVALATGDPGAYFANIETLLTRAKTAYAAGQPDAAEEALIGAYLDNFEFLEKPLGTVNKPLEGQLEKTLRETLRGLLKQKVSPAEFAAAVDAARKDLGRARQALK